MIKFQISKYNTSLWQYKNKKFIQGNNFIQPFESSYLESTFLSNEFTKVFIIRERNFQKNKNILFKEPTTIKKINTHQLNEVIIETNDSNLEFAIIIIDNENAITKLIKGSSNNVPIYYTKNSKCIHASWDINDLYYSLSANNVFNYHTLASHLSLDFNYTTSTIYNEINIVSERSEVIFNGFEKTKVNLPEPSPIYKERVIKPEVNVVEVFLSLLRKKLLIHGINSNNFICELSGGLDSAIVAITAAHINNNPIKTIGMILNGEMGEQQKRRRNELIEKFKIIDSPVCIDGFYPLKNDGETLSNGKVSIYDEIYHDALQYSLSSLSIASGAILTGIGGDELSLVYENQTSCDNLISPTKSSQNEIAPLPNPSITKSAIMSAQSRATVFLKNGLWPINPLCCPNIVKFCQYLPRKIKEKRKIHRSILTNYGMSDDYIYPNIRENFSEFYETAMKVNNKNNIINLIKKSQLHEMGYIDKEVLLKSFINYCEKNIDHNPLIYYVISSLEYNLKFIRSLNS